MARGLRAPRRRAAAAGATGSGRKTVVNWLAGGVSLALLVTIAVVTAGYDARETPREEPSVWTMRSAGQYARVNTLTAEIDTVRSVEDPTAVLQSGSAGVVLSHGNGRAWTIDPSLPADLVEEVASTDTENTEAAQPAVDIEATAEANADATATLATRTPDGTREVISSSAGVLFRTEDGAVYLSDFEATEGQSLTATGPELGAPRQLDPIADERAEAEASGSDAPAAYRADAVAIDADGRVAMYSTAEAAVRWYDAARGAFDTRSSAVPDDATTAEAVQLAIVAGDWALLDRDAAQLWREGSASPTTLDLVGDAKLQSSSLRGAGIDVWVADEAGLWSASDDGATRVSAFDGIPAQPVEVSGERYAAWIGGEEGQLWAANAGPITLDLDANVELPGTLAPTIRTSGSSALVSEDQTGMLWTVPDGTLIPVEQWSLVDPPKERDGTVVVTDVTEQEPPVAVADEFGVRATEPAPLPVMLNDFDPNRKDVLTIVPDALGEGLPETFGTVAMLADGQGLTFQPAAGASGSATFSYRITDGALVSEPASVALTVAAPETNSAPQWCPVQGCQREWPSPELAPGGTLVLPVLEGWVDPEGDPMMLESATPVDPEEPVRALVTAAGTLALRHLDPNAADSEVAVRIVVADATGQRTERDLRVQLRSNAKAEMVPIASTVQVGQTSALRPLTRITGGSGSFALVDAQVQSGSAGVTVNAGVGTIEVSATEPGVTVVAVTARDAVTEAEISGNLRVTAVETRPRLGVPPLHAFVRPLADTTVDVLDAIPSANSRALVVRSANVIDGELRADVVEYSKVRVSGNTPDGGTGRIGSADVIVADGDDVATGRLTVFQVPDSGSTGAIAVADTATVRAGAVTDIAVLENDVASPGQRLVLHPDVTGSGALGELVFASGNTVRYLAPTEPGTYTLSYTTYSASSPEASDVGQVRVTVQPRDGNRDPQPRTLTVRLAPGEQASASVPLSNVDPDGDRVRLTGVGASEDPQISATLAPRSAAIEVSASKRTEAGMRVMSYTVRDEFGGEATGRLRVIVTDADPTGGAPVTYSDYVRLSQGATEPAVVRPLDNDVDPANGELEIVDVVPNVAGGKDSPQYRELAARLDTSEIADGRVTVTGASELGTVSYRYTARSSESTSTSDGLIVVQVSARVGQQAPTVIDTVLSARDRTELERGGVDVVTDRVYWAGGDVRSLKLSVWGSAAERFTAQGTKITGAYRAEGDLVPFKLAGTDSTGAEVATFGFLVIPPLDELRLTLKPGITPLQVEEGQSVNAALGDLVDLASGDTAEFKLGAFPAQRAQAACESTSAASLRYTAGKEGPWNDTCLVSVKLTQQNTWTQLAVPIAVVPAEPVAELDGLTRTIAPGVAESINLRDMVQWQGGREGDAGKLTFGVSGGGASFEVTANGATAQVVARADAVPGAQEALVVSVAGAGESQASLVLRVGDAARDTPRGATVQLNCTVGANCQTQLAGAPGEYDPFQGKTGGGLKLESVTGATCAVATFQLAGDGVSVGWPNGAQGAGGQCTASFTVRDAQGRVGSGTIELDAQGVPRPPVGVSAVSYSSTSVTLDVQLSPTASYPGVTGVRILQDSGAAAASCSAGGGSYRCTVSGLNNGDKHSFTAVATNSVGDSDPSASAVTAWAYEAPQAPSVQSKQISAESSETGTVRLTIAGQSGTRGYRILTDAGERTEAGRNVTVNVSGLAVGERDYSVIPISEFDPPPGGAPEGTFATGRVSVGGLPVVGLSLSSDAGTNQVSAAVSVDARGGADVKIDAESGTGCTPNKAPSDSPFTITGTAYEVMTVTACARNEWGAAAPVSESIRVGGNLPAPVVASGWTIASAPSASGGVARYGLAAAPSVTSLGSGYALEYFANGASVGSSFPSDVQGGATYAVRQCKTSEPGGAFCSESVALTGNAPGTVAVDVSGCIPSTATNAELLVRVSPHAQSSATVTFDHAAAQLTVLWSGAYAALNTLTVSVCAQPDPAPSAGG